MFYNYLRGDIMDDLVLVNEEHPISRWYVPDDLVVVDNNENNFHNYSDPNMKPMVSKRVLINFLKLQKNAFENGYNIIIDNGYRSYDYQNEMWFIIYNQYLKTLDIKDEVKRTKEAFELTSKRVAIPGHSEHQTGLAIDIACLRDGIFLEDMTDTDECNWMIDNAYKYGFILRYPKGKEKITGFMYEPWHYRYVGYPVSLDFYDGKYKTLEEYHKEKKLVL